MKNRYSIENVIGKILSVKLRNKNGYGLVNSADLGRLLFLSSASQLNLIQNEKDFELILQQILDNPPILSSSYSQGLFGFLTLLVHFDIENVVDFDDNFFDQFDNLAIRTVSDYIHKKKDYDFLHGAQGILHFSLLRNNTASQIVLSLFIDFLEDRINNYGVYEIDRIGGRFEKRYNLGLAHGLPSIIISLARCINQGLDPNDKALVLVNKLCDAIMHFISANHLSLSLFPHVVSDENLFLNDKQENRNYTGRMGWCYGDLGIALSFYYMGKWTSNSEYLKISNLIFNHTLKRKELNVNYVRDAGFCHGTSGIAAIYNRMYFNTKDEKFKTARDYWVDQTIKMAYHKDGLAGFKAFKPSKGFVINYGLLEGVYGIGVVLASILSEKEPTWDRLFLLS